MSPGRRMLVAAAVVAVAVAAAGRLVFDRLVAPREPAPAPAVAPPPAAPAPVAKVIRIAGAPERTAADRSWATVKAGDVLGVDDAIRTRPRESVEVALGERSRFVVAEGSELAIRELSAAVHRLRLSRGRISVDYEADGSRVLRVESERGDAMAEAASARFSVLASGVSFAVATQTGVVNLRSQDVIVAVAEGQQAVARAGAPPGPASAVPAEVLLKVAAASRLDGRGRCAAVEGRAWPGAEVRADGVAVPTDRSGAFRAEFTAAATRRRRLVLTVRDAAGRTRTREVPCDVDGASISVEWRR